LSTKKFKYASKRLITEKALNEIYLPVRNYFQNCDQICKNRPNCLFFFSKWDRGLQSQCCHNLYW